MTVIFVAYEVTSDTVEKIQILLDEVAATDPSWNGATFTIERSDFTCIPEDDSADAVKLLRKINEIVDGY